MSTTAEPVAEVGRALDRLARRDPALRAMREVVPEAATAAARGLTGDRGPLYGLPIVVKGPGGLTAPQTRRLVAAGAVPIGTTSTPRGPGYQTWGHTDRGPTRNPWRPDLSPGGSSAGSAAAVGAGIVALGSGSDGAGSVRIPAAWCGVYGYKPTTALARRAGHRDPSGLSVPGPLVRDPGLLAPWAAAVLGPLAPGAPLRSATWSPDLGFAGHLLDAEVVEIAARGARELAARAGLRRVETVVTLSDPQAAWEAAREAAREAAPAGHRGNDAALAALFGHVDVLITPTTPGRPHGHGGPGDDLSVALTWAFNVSGHPAVSVPAGRTADGAPVGMQLVVRQHADAALLELVARHCRPAPAAPMMPG